MSNNSRVAGDGRFTVSLDEGVIKRVGELREVWLVSTERMQF